MRVDALMTRDVVTVRRDTPLKVVAELLARHRITGVPVVERDGTLAGVVSESDLLWKEEGTPGRHRFIDAVLGDEAARAKRDAQTAGEAMSRPVVSVPESTTVADAARIMLDEGVRRLPVVRDGALVGIVTRTDLIRAFARSDEAIAREIRDDVIVRMHWISPARIGVEVRDGRVSMRGQVENEDLADSVTYFVARVPGVVSVDSHLSWPKAGARSRLAT